MKTSTISSVGALLCGLFSSCAAHGPISQSAFHGAAEASDPVPSAAAPEAPRPSTPAPFSQPQPAPDHSLAVKYTGCVQPATLGQRDTVASNYQVVHFCTDRDDRTAAQLAARQAVVDSLVAWMEAPEWPRILVSAAVCVEESRIAEAKANLTRDKKFSRRFSAASGSYIPGQEWVVQNSEDKIASIRSENKKLTPFLTCSDPAVSAFADCHHTPNDHNHNTWYSVEVSRVGDPVNVNGVGRPASELVDETCIGAALHARDAQASAAR